MAFRLPQAAPQRQVPIHQRQVASRPSSLQRPLDQSQEWVLFSPAETQPYTPTVDTPQTAGASRLSDFGSLNSVVPPSQEQEHDDADDLDSLDDGLYEFREPLRTPGSRQIDHNSGTVLPGHDGLGSFNASSTPAQEQIWQHERFNPRRHSSHHQRQPSNLTQRLGTIEDEPEHDHPFVEDEKLDRIERWRLDQSRIMLDEVKKEARRRRRLSQSQVQSIPAVVDTKEIVNEDTPVAEDTAAPAKESETFWQRITRRVIKDFMGIDEPLLSVILGESLPDDEELSSTPKALDSTISKHLENADEEHLVPGWEDRLLKRLARELNIIVHSLSDHPGTFSTYAKPETYDYAGIPIARKHPPIPEQDVLELGQTPKAVDSPSALFVPTIPHAKEDTEATESEHEAGWGIEDSKPAKDLEAAELEYWERTPDLKQVFAYLSRRFLKRGPQTPISYSEISSSPTEGIATHSTPASLRRAAIIRQHHPLVSRAHEANLAKQDKFQAHQRRSSMKSIAERLEAQATSECGRETLSASLRSLKRVGDDCASQSTKKSKTSRSRKHYWEVGSDSAAAALGGMGSWGEV